MTGRRHALLAFCALVFVTAESPAASEKPESQKPERPPAPELAVSSDTGPLKTGDRTNHAAPTFVGKARPGATVTLYAGDKKLGRVEADANGNWTMIAGTPLIDGEHAITLAQTPPGGPAGPRSDPLIVTVDTQPPATPTIDRVEVRARVLKGEEATRLGLSAQGMAEPGSRVTVFLAEESQGAADADGAGKWSFTRDNARPAGLYAISARTADAAGNNGPRSDTVFVMTGENISPALAGLLILLPGIITLVARAIMEWWPRGLFRWLFASLIARRASAQGDSEKRAKDNAVGSAKTAQEPAAGANDAKDDSSLTPAKPAAQSDAEKQAERDLNPWLICVISLSWLGVFALFWKYDGGLAGDVKFFHSDLAFPLFVPAFGLLGSLIFVIDIFRRGTDSSVSREFAMRLVLGPYVAIVTVLFFSGTFDLSDASGPALGKLETQAAVAFFSGFLVVLVLQHLIERGNAWLGRWRETHRYVPSTIATKLKLDMEDDMRLRAAGLKRISQITALSKDDIDDMCKKTDLDERFLGPLVEEHRRKDREEKRKRLEAKLGTRVWEKLKPKNITSLEDVAALGPAEVKELTKELGLRKGVLESFSEECKAFLYPK
ncbi:MAG: Ig-like domain-containing protein [Alphaproteobacteria bacterium]|nr:Ig-like domain-containing protein [Alphaproteobacteria bacterium]